MGQFSWITQDTNDSIRNNVRFGDNRGKAFMWDNKGNKWEEESYEGYGIFGGKDYYKLLAEMNPDAVKKLGKELNGDEDHDRSIGIDIAYADDIPCFFPNLTRNDNWEWKKSEPQRCPNQGWSDLGSDGTEEDYQEE